MQFMGQKPSSNVPRYGINFYKAYAIYCDCVLRTEDSSEFKIHRVLLAQNEYFHALFSFEANVNNNTTDILMKGIESQTLRQVLQYIYEGALHLDEENVLDLRVAADYLLLDDLMEQCCNFAIRRMTPSNCLTFLTAASRCQRFNILRECSRYVKVHFEEIVKTFPKDIGNLDIEVLKELLSDNNLNVTSEDTVRMAIDNWMKKDLLNRKRHRPDLVNYIRSEEIDHSSRIVQVSKEISNPLCINTFQVTQPIMKPSFRINKEPRLPKYLHVGFHISETSTVVYLTSDEELDFWKKITDVRGFPDVIGPIGKYIYFFYPSENVAQRYDMLEDQLDPLASMSVPRVFYYIVELHGMIYAFGGCGEEDDYDDIMSFEWYYPFTETWNLSDSAISISGAVAMNGKIYVLGNYYNRIERETMMVTQFYDLTTNVWTTVASPRVLRSSCSAVAFENRMYLIGGRNKWNDFENTILRSVEEYDPALDVWSSMPDLPLLYDRLHAKVLDGTILVFEDKKSAVPLLHWDGGRRAWQKVESVMTIYSYGIVDDASVVRELVKRNRRSIIEWERNLSDKIDDNRIISFFL